MLRLISHNVDHDKHFPAITAMCEKVSPDAFCALEIYEKDLERFEVFFNSKGHFVPACYMSVPDPEKKMTHCYLRGAAFFSKYPIISFTYTYYFRDEHSLVVKVPGDAIDIAMALCEAVVEKDGVPYKICFTHFSKSPLEGGDADDTQRANLQKLFSILDTKGEFVLCGDFNAPRGKEIFSTISERYTDNIPTTCTRSLDPDLHRRPDLELMVDGLFTTPAFHASDVHFETGVSDHYAIVANISRDN